MEEILVGAFYILVIMACLAFIAATILLTPWLWQHAPLWVSMSWWVVMFLVYSYALGSLILR